MKEPSQKFAQTFHVEADPTTDKKFQFIKDNFRFSVLTSKLLRVEYSKDCLFTDKPTQAVLFRNIAKPEFRIIENESQVVVSTKDTVFCYDTQKKKMLSITLKNGGYVTDFKKGNLKGTYRTLDMANGSIPLEDGLISTNGVSMIDDSKSVILNENGTISERSKCIDEYYFAYGKNYRECIKDFFALCGEVPLVPRYCLGNWWSRYKDYTQQEYIDLMQQFIDREIPISVATIDMDWHWVDVVKRFGKKDSVYQRDHFPTLAEIVQSQGWTGYSWNTELFPDYKEMFKYLKDNNFKITLNLHPAQGVRPFEDMYEQMAEKMGIDPKTKEHIKFDFTDPKFIEAYFDVLHKPYEKDGVDFWWIDWQQEKNTKIAGLDPLWALNHYHTLAFNDENKRPLILSRFAQVGSHRYPLGFSGDTMITWASLDFQPYFTITAANVGYTWWSHDIGGHQRGRRDDELYARWVQFGQYSPIMRLHSTKDEFMGKEPWKYSFAAKEAATSAMRQRHAMIPYIYSMNRRTNKDAIALCEPIYYSYPEKSEAYEIKNEYFFGSELLVVPVTTKMSKRTNLAKTRVWLPKGRWTDIYNGYIYQGEQFVDMYRGIESIPVLAKEGAIIPLSDNEKTNDSSNPKNMTIRVFRGNNKFELYEDDGETMNFKDGAFAVTKMSVCEKGSDLAFKISSVEGDRSVTAQLRNYTVVFEDIESAREISITINGKEKNAKIETKNQKVYVYINAVRPSQTVLVSLKETTTKQNKGKKELVVDLLSKYQLDTTYKMIKFMSYIKDINKPFPIDDEDLKGPIDEIGKLKY